jgi:hypothetical protein
MSPDMAENVPEAPLQFHYIKSPDYREFSCDGVIGSLTPTGQKICLSVYGERAPIPRVVEYSVQAEEGGKVVGFDERTAMPSHVETRQGVIRNVEASIYLEIEAARRLVDWLQARIVEFESRK